MTHNASSYPFLSPWTRDRILHFLYPAGEKSSSSLNEPRDMTHITVAVEENHSPGPREVPLKPPRVDCWITTRMITSNELGRTRFDLESSVMCFWNRRFHTRWMSQENWSDKKKKKDNKERRRMWDAAARRATNAIFSSQQACSPPIRSCSSSICRPCNLL